MAPSTIINIVVVLAGAMAAFAGMRVTLRNLKEQHEKDRDADDARHEKLEGKLDALAETQTRIRLIQAEHGVRLTHLEEKE